MEPLDDDQQLDELHACALEEQHQLLATLLVRRLVVEAESAAHTVRERDDERREKRDLPFDNIVEFGVGFLHKGDDKMRQRDVLPIRHDAALGCLHLVAVGVGVCLRLCSRALLRLSVWLLCWK